MKLVTVGGSPVSPVLFLGKAELQKPPIRIYINTYVYVISCWFPASPANSLAVHRIVIERFRTSIVQISSELSLEFKTIDRLLPYNFEGWGRIGASTIVTTYVFLFSFFLSSVSVHDPTEILLF